MATQVQFRRGTAAQNNNFTGAEGELSVNLSNYSLRLHDGVTAGGYEIARKDFSNATFGASVLPSLNTTYNLGSSGFKFLNVHSQEFTGDLTGNADTATALQTARNINGVSFDGTADITIEASIDKTLFISEGLEDTGGLTSFDGGTDVTLRLKNAPNFSDTNLLKWDNTNEQFVDSIVTDNGTTVTAAGNLTVTGDLLVQGATTTISTTNLEVTDKLIIIGDGTTTTQAADGAGFNIGTSGVSLTYDLANTSWTSSESMNLATGKTYKIAGTTVIGSTSLGANIVSSSLTSVGTLSSLDVSGATTLTSLNVSGNSTFQSNVYLGDGDTLHFGAAGDLQIYHTGSASNIKENGTGNLNIWGDHIIFWNSAGSEVKAGFVTDGKVDLYYNNVRKFETRVDGAEIFGDLYVKDIVRKDTSNAEITKTYVKTGDTSTSSLGDHSLTIETWAATDYNAVDYVFYTVAQNGEKEVTKFTVLADGSGDVWTTEQNTLRSDDNNPTIELEARWISNKVYIVLTPSSNSNDVVYKMSATAFVV